MLFFCFFAVCYGLGLNYGPLVNDTHIDGKNIKYFNKNCTIIQGSLHFQSSTFNGLVIFSNFIM